MISGRPELVDMEGRLTTDADGVYRDDICRQLQQSVVVVQQQLQAGLAPEDYATAERLKEALVAAETIVRQYWAAVHNNESC